MSEYFVSTVNIHELHFLLKIKFPTDFHYLVKYRVTEKKDRISQTNFRQKFGL
jgi:hypothetical protein